MNFDLMKFDITKVDITKLDIKDIKTIKGIGIAFLLLVIILDLLIFSCLINNIGQVDLHRQKDAKVVNFLNDLISRKDKLATAHLVPTNKIDDLLDNVQVIARKNNIDAHIGAYMDIDQITPTAASKDQKGKDQQQNNKIDFYSRKIFPINISGSLKDVGTFLTSLRNMPDAILDITSIDLTADREKSSNVQAQIKFVVLTMRDDENQ